jgi:hypothetical protein
LMLILLIGYCMKKICVLDLRKQVFCNIWQEENLKIQNYQ